MLTQEPAPPDTDRRFSYSVLVVPGGTMSELPTELVPMTALATTEPGM
ncbi:hypothetical protein OG741_33140 [Streptomyces sp. NBC_01410]